jgi:hypothetical protein
MTEFTGHDWPYEPLEQQRKALKDGEYHILLAGEIYDVDAIHAIITTLSFLQRYGRPFHRLYKLVRHRPSSVSSVIRCEIPFKHQSFTVSSHRIAMLRMLLEHCSDSTLYEITHCENGELISEKNFPEYEPGALNATLEAALKERGWVEPTGKPFYDTIEQWQERKKLGKKAPVLSIHRFYDELAHLWRKKR